LSGSEASGTYRLYALQYAQRDGLRGQHFLGYDSTSGLPHPTAYYVWLAVSQSHVVMIDAGMTPEVAATLPDTTYLAGPLDLLSALDVQPSVVETVILTHLHYDHTGLVGSLPWSEFVVQRDEWDYWHGPWARRIGREAWLRSDQDIAVLDEARAQGRVVLVEGDHELQPGISVHRVGGHTAGMQVVRVRTRKGVAVVASDASHFFENLEADHPAPLLHDMPEVYGAYDRVRELADPADFYLPGHDPGVMARYPDRVHGQPHIAVVA
jgi:glyoxylase-like metal-dependent hydrolase (beta-lactamase superfamily II)